MVIDENEARIARSTQAAELPGQTHLIGSENAMFSAENRLGGAPKRDRRGACPTQKAWKSARFDAFAAAELLVTFPGVS